MTFYSLKLLDPRSDSHNSFMNDINNQFTAFSICELGLPVFLRLWLDALTSEHSRREQLTSGFHSRRLGRQPSLLFT